MKFIIATNNKGKLRDFNNILSSLGHCAVSLSEAGITCKAEENGATFAENAFIKAKAVFDIAHCPVIADDSGLSVNALSGAPGVYSARYGGPDLDDRGRCNYLLENMAQIDDSERTASFICSLCCILSQNNIIEVCGEVEGRILKEIRGENGFGYDPLFYVEKYQKTFGELSDECKNEISHRAEALKKLSIRLNTVRII